MEMRMRECIAGDGGHACIPEIDGNSACERATCSQSRRKAPGCKLKSFSRFSGMKLKIGAAAEKKGERAPFGDDCSKQLVCGSHSAHANPEWRI